MADKTRKNDKLIMWADKRFKQKWLLKFILNSDQSERKTQGLHVLKKLSGAEGPVIKLVTDAHVSVPAEFTASALLQFSQSNDTDSSPVQWDRCRIIVKKYSLKFLYTPSLNTCSIRLLINDFSFWVSEEGFRLKEDPVPCMELMSVKSLLKDMWEKQKEEARESVTLGQSSEVSSIALSALLSQMNKDSLVDTYTQSHQDDQGPSQSMLAQAESSRLVGVTEVTKEIPLHCLAEMPQSLTEDLLDIRRFLISPKDTSALKAIPEWQPGYVLPTMASRSSEQVNQTEQEEDSRFLSIRKRIVKITNKTLATSHFGSSESGSSQVQRKGPVRSCVITSDKPTTPICNISVQVGDSLLCGSSNEAAAREKAVPDTKECSAQVGSSLLNCSELSLNGDQSQSVDGPQLNLPSDFIFHPVFLGESSTVTTDQGENPAFKEPYLPIRLQTERVQGDVDDGGSFVASTQIDRGNDGAPRPDFEHISPVQDSQRDHRLKDFETLNELDFNLDSLSEPKDLRAPVLQHKSESDVSAPKDSEKSVKYSAAPNSVTVNPNCESVTSPCLPTMCYKTYKDGLSVSGDPTVNPGLTTNTSSNHTVPESTVGSITVKPLSDNIGNKTDENIEQSQNLEDNVGVLSNLGQKLSSTPETSHLGSGSVADSQNVVSTSDSDPLVAKQNVVSQDKEILQKTSPTTTGDGTINRENIVSSETAEDRRLRELMKVSRLQNSGNKYLNAEHVGDQSDVISDGNTQRNQPFVIQPSSSAISGVHMSMLGAFNIPTGNLAPAKFSSCLSPEERRLQMMRQVIVTSESYKSNKVDTHKEVASCNVEQTNKDVISGTDAEQKMVEKLDIDEEFVGGVNDSTEVSNERKESNDEDLIIEKVIRPRNRNPNGNMSINCTTSMVFKIEPLSDSESQEVPNIKRKRKHSKSKNIDKSDKSAGETEIIDKLPENGETNSFVVQAQVHATQESDKENSDTIMGEEIHENTIEDNSKDTSPAVGVSSPDNVGIQENETSLDSISKEMGIQINAKILGKQIHENAKEDSFKDTATAVRESSPDHVAIQENETSLDSVSKEAGIQINAQKVAAEISPKDDAVGIQENETSLDSVSKEAGIQINAKIVGKQIHENAKEDSFKDTATAVSESSPDHVGIQENETSLDSVSKEAGIQINAKKVAAEISPKDDAVELGSVPDFGANEDILTLDSSDLHSCEEPQEQKQKKKASSSVKQSGKKHQRKRNRIIDSDEEGGSVSLKNILASGKRQSKSKKKISDSDAEEIDTDWMPSPVKQSRTRSTRVSQPRFSFSKGKSVTENIQDMLGSKKTSQLDSSVLFTEKTPKGKAGHGKHSAQVRRSSRKHRLFNEGSEMLMSKAPEDLASVVEEEVVKESPAVKVVTRSRQKNMEKMEDSASIVEEKVMKESSAVKVVTRSRQRNVGKSTEKTSDDRAIRTQMTQNDGVSYDASPKRDQSAGKFTTNEENSATDLLEAVQKDSAQVNAHPSKDTPKDISEDHVEETVTTASSNHDQEEKQENTFENITIKKEKLSVSPVMFAQGGTMFKVLQPIVCLEPIVISDSEDITLSKDTLHKLTDSRKDPSKKSAKEKNLELAGTNKDHSNQAIPGMLNKSSSSEICETSFSPTSIHTSQQDLQSTDTEHLYESCEESMNEKSFSKLNDESTNAEIVVGDSGKELEKPNENPSEKVPVDAVQDNHMGDNPTIDTENNIEVPLAFSSDKSEDNIPELLTDSVISCGMTNDDNAMQDLSDERPDLSSKGAQKDASNREKIHKPSDKSDETDDDNAMQDLSDERRDLSPKGVQGDASNQEKIHKPSDKSDETEVISCKNASMAENEAVAMPDKSVVSNITESSSLDVLVGPQKVKSPIKTSLVESCASSDRSCIDGKVDIKISENSGKECFSDVFKNTTDQDSEPLMHSVPSPVLAIRLEKASVDHDIVNKANDEPMEEQAANRSCENSYQEEGTDEEILLPEEKPDEVQSNQLSEKYPLVADVKNQNSDAANTTDMNNEECGSLDKSGEEVTPAVKTREDLIASDKPNKQISSPDKSIEVSPPTEESIEVIPPTDESVKNPIKTPRKQNEMDDIRVSHVEPNDESIAHQSTSVECAQIEKNGVNGSSDCIVNANAMSPVEIQSDNRDAEVDKNHSGIVNGDDALDVSSEKAMMTEEITKDNEKETECQISNREGHSDNETLEKPIDTLTRVPCLLHKANNNNIEERPSVDTIGDDENVEKLLKDSGMDETSLRCESTTNLTIPTPEMSLQCGQRSKGEGYSSQGQSGEQTISPSGGVVSELLGELSDADQSNEEETDDSILGRLQELLDEQIEREDKHNLLKLSFEPKTKSALMSYFGLDH